MDKEIFIEQYVDKDLIKKALVNQFWNQVNKMFIEIQAMHSSMSDKEVYDTLFANKDTLRILFYSGKKTGNGIDVRSSKFHTYKKLCLNFIKYLKNLNLISHYDFVYNYITDLKLSDVLVINYENEIYFGDLKEILQYIDTIGERCFANSKRKRFEPYSENDLLVYKTMAILLWNGLTLENMLQIKSEDLLKHENNFFILFNGNLIEITKLEYSILKLYDTSLEQRGLPSGKLTRFKDNGFLIKPPRQFEKNNAISNDLFGYIKKINRVSSALQLPFLFNQNTIRISGYFNKIYNKYPNDIKLALEYLKEDKNVSLYNYSQLYIQWIQLFRNE